MGREKEMTEKPNKSFQILIKECEKIGYGTWPVELKIHQGRCVGFKSLDSPQIKYSENWEKEEKGEGV